MPITKPTNCLDSGSLLLSGTENRIYAYRRAHTHTHTHTHTQAQRLTVTPQTQWSCTLSLAYTASRRQFTLINRDQASRIAQSKISSRTVQSNEPWSYLVQSSCFLFRFELNTINRSYRWALILEKSRFSLRSDSSPHFYENFDKLW